MLKIYVVIFFLIFFKNSISYSQIQIKYKIDEEIITNVDILNEGKYLIFLRPSLNKLPQEEMIKISTNSLIKEIIKKKELKKIFKDIEKKEYTEIKKNLFNFKKVKNENEFLNLIKKNNISYDKILICIYSALLFIGYFSIYSSSFSGTETKILTVSTISGKQLIFIIVSLITGLLILLTDVKFIIRSSYFLYALSIISLILVLIFGKEVGGAKAWFSMGGFGFQPSEFVKLTTILSISKYIHDNEIYLNSLKYLKKHLYNCDLKING